MGLHVTRSAIITALCTKLAEIPALKIVKPYHGELDRYSKKVQLKQEIFPAEVNLTTPFALVISKNRERVEDKGPSLRFKHDLSIYIGYANEHNFNDTSVSPIFGIMDSVVEKLAGKQIIPGAGVMTLLSDGDYIITTDLFTVYDMKFYQLEIGT